MRTISLNKSERYFLDGKFFLVKRGKVITRDILENGKIITSENSLKEGEVIGNFFNILPENNFFVPEIDIEVEALENNTILEEFAFSFDKIMGDIYIQKIFSQLVKKAIIKFLQQLYNTKGYILAILKLHLNDNGYVYKKEISYENFNISKSQFYLIYSNLKKENFLSEVDNKIFLNLKKIDPYLEKLGET